MRGALILSAALVAALALCGGCFSPQKPACAFSCVAPPHACPTGYTCGSDGVCHNDTATGECLLDAQDGGIDANGTGAER